MRVFFLTLILALATPFGNADAAAATCDGANLLDRLRTEDPALHTELFQRAHAIPNAKGRFWEVTGNGAPPSYLFGTYHTQQARRTVPAEIWPTLQGARIAIFELSLEQQDAMQKRIASDPLFTFDPELPPLAMRFCIASCCLRCWPFPRAICRP